jgi:hypothetical protein
VSLRINRGFETVNLNMGFKFKYSHEIGTFEYDLWRTDKGYGRKDRIGSVNPAVAFV